MKNVETVVVSGPAASTVPHLFPGCLSAFELNSGVEPKRKRTWSGKAPPDWVGWLPRGLLRFVARFVSFAGPREMTFKYEPVFFKGSIIATHGVQRERSASIANGKQH